MFCTNRLDKKVRYQILLFPAFLIENHQILINMTEKTPFSFIVT